MTREEAISKLNELIECTVDRGMIDDICYEVIEFLEAQEPRVMTCEEYSDWCKLPDCERKPVAVEDRRTNSLVWCWWAAVAPDHDMTAYRIWTAWPTDAQREAVKWE